MEYQLGSFINFDNALTEVSLLTQLASNYEKTENANEYAALNKSALLLLTAKFEVFVEEVVVEYIDIINSMNLANQLISEKLKVRHSISRIKDIVEIIDNHNKDSKKIEVFKELALLWQDEERNFDGLSIPNKFNYGKHGSKEMIRLFSNIDIEDIFKTIVIYSDTESTLLSGVEEVDLQGIINNITNQRNMITHQDKSPSMTHKDIEKYISCFTMFSKQLCEYLESKLHALSDEFKMYKQIASQKEQVRPRFVFRKKTNVQ